MTRTWRRSGFPWRHVIPRRQYFRSAAIARACPEISWHIDRVAVYTLLDGISTVVAVLGFIVASPFWLVSRLASGVWNRIPDFARERGRMIEEAYLVVSLDEIRRRLGLDPLPTPCRKPIPDEAVSDGH